MLEHTRHSRAVTKWVEGKPVASFWQGLSLGGRMNLAIASYRCPRCGLLELYAPATATDAR